MKTIGTILPAVALFFTVSTAHAGALWTADWSVPKPNVISDSGNNEFLLSAGPAFNGNGNASNILATQITVQTPFKGSTDTWTEQNYSVDLLLTDSASKASTTLVFSGALSGTATPTGSSITNEPVSGKTSYNVTLGGNQYTASIGPFVANGSGTNVGSLDAQVSVSVTDNSPPPPPTNETPEPSTLVLMGLGLCSAVAAARRQRTAATAVFAVA